MLALWLTAGMVRFEGVCREVRQDTLRLHVVAASNSVEDQAVKLRVKDAVAAQAAELFQNCQSLPEAERTAAACLGRLQLAACRAAAQAGFQGPVSVYLTRMYFGTRQYEDFTLPAGWYKALRVELGAHRGQNWWCVLYPSLCLPGCGGDAYPRQEEQTLISQEYEVRFALLEAWQRLTGQDRSEPPDPELPQAGEEAEVQAAGPSPEEAPDSAQGPEAARQGEAPPAKREAC